MSATGIFLLATWRSSQHAAADSIGEPESVAGLRFSLWFNHILIVDEG